jgi:hypothetical protein
MLGFARSRQIVVLTRKKDNLRRHAIMLQRAELLLALFDRNAEVIVGMKNERWCADVVCIF